LVARRLTRIKDNRNHYGINPQAARELYARAAKESFALGAFNIDDQETLLAIARAAAAKKSPVLVEVSKDEAEMIGLHNLRCW
jgi:fructose-bisphosphate aldolase class II